MYNKQQISDIVKDVRIILDQNQVEDGVLSANRDTLELDEIIKQKIIHAARLILDVVPLHRIDKSLFNSGNVIDFEESTSSTEPQTVNRPADFLRLYDMFVQGETSQATQDSDPIVGKSWEKHLSSFSLTDSEEYLITNSAFIGVRPNEKRPMVFYNMAQGFFECYGCKYGKARMYYIMLPSVVTLDDNDQELEEPYIGFPDILYEALLYQTASLVETAYKNAQAAQMYSSIARGYMGIDEVETTKQSQKQK